MFAQKLREARKACGLTLEELAEKYNKKYNGGLSKGTLSKYENGKQEPMISTVSNLASLLNVSVDYLTNNEIQVKPQDQRELEEYLEELRTRPEMKMLFSLAKGASKKDVEQAVKIIEALQKQ